MKWLKRTAWLSCLVVLLYSTTALAYIPAPTLNINKTTALVGENFTLTWTSCSGATRYTVQISNYSDFSTFLGSGLIYYTTSATLNTSYSGTFYFRVIADNEYTFESSVFGNVKSIVITDGTPPDPANDLYISSKSCPTAYVGQEFCCSVTLKNSGTNCYAVGEVDVDYDSGPSLTFSNDLYTTDFTLCQNETKVMSGFCATASTIGTSVMNIDVTVSGTAYNNIDTFSLPINCLAECASGEVGCNGTAQRYTCGEAGDGDSCLDKIYTNCAAGYTCSSGSCQAIPPPAAPTLSISTATPADNTAYTVSWTNTGGGFEILEATNSSFTGANGWSTASTSMTFTHDVSVTTTYYYRVRAMDSYGTYSGWSNVITATISPACISNCTSGDVGCTTSTVRYDCQQVQTGCWQKVDVQTCSLGCSAGACINCLPECTLYTAGCSSTTQEWTCGEAFDGDTCLDKVYSNCAANQECVSDQCLDINYPPVFSNPNFNPSNISLQITVSDANGDNLSWVRVYLFTPAMEFIGNYYMSVLSGSNSQQGIVYTIDLSSWADGSYKYFMIASDGKVQADSKTVLSFTICRPNIQCGQWSNCYYARPIAPPGYNIDDWIQNRACVDVNGCSAETDYEWKMCDCNYTSFQWVGGYPLEIREGESAVFKLTWEGNCTGDVLSVRKQIGSPPFCYCSNDVWTNKDDPEPLTVNASGTHNKEEYFSMSLPYADAYYRLFLGRVTGFQSLYTPIMPTSNYLNVTPASFPADSDDLKRYIELAQLPTVCNSDVTLSDQCYKYWQDMGISYEEQLIESMSAYDLIWIGTCFGCAAATLGEPMLVLTWAGGPVPGTCSTALVIAGGLACDFCVQVPIVTINPANAAAVSKVIVGNRAFSRINDLGELAIDASYLPVKNGAYVRYVDDTGKLMTEAYGLSTAGSNSLLFNAKIRSIPVEFLQNYHVIDVNLNVVPLNLESFHQVTLGFNAEVAENYWKTLGNMFEDGLYKQEATYVWEMANGGKLGPISDHIQEVVPTVGIKYAHVQYAEFYHKWVINFNLDTAVLPSRNGGLIPQWEAAVYGMLPQEYIHVANLELIERFSNPKGVTYVLNYIPEGPEATNRWFAEFYAHTIYLDLVQNDPVRYSKYLDSIYGLIHSANGGIDGWIADVVKYSKSESTMLYSQQAYQLIKTADSAAAQRALSQLDNADAFLARNAKIEDDVYRLHMDMVDEPGYVATQGMDDILVRYKMVKGPDVPPHSGGSSQPAKSFLGCTLSDTGNSGYLTLLVALLPAIILLLRKYLRHSRI